MVNIKVRYYTLTTTTSMQLAFEIPYNIIKRKDEDYFLTDTHAIVKFDTNFRKYIWMDNTEYKYETDIDKELFLHNLNILLTIDII